LVCRAAATGSLQPFFWECGAAVLSGTILSNLLAGSSSPGLQLILWQIWQVWIVGEPLRFRLLSGFV
jgi:hypothetical protein